MTAGPTWIFDGSPLADPHGCGERAVQFLKLLKHPKSTAAGSRFQLWPFQERIVRRVYGDTREEGRRRVQTVFMMLPRGNRKTALAGGLALLHTLGPERLPGGYAISAAADQQQSRIAFEEAKMIVEATPQIHRVVTIRDTRNRIAYGKIGSELHSISSDGKTKHGSTPTFIIADELHAWTKASLWEAMRTGLAKTPNSLLWIITTAGRGKMNLAWPLYEYARKVQGGAIDDPGFLPILFEPDEGDDWEDEALWHRVNPGLAHGFPDIEGLRQYAREARERSIERDIFRQYHLNTWLDGSATPWVEPAVYDAPSNAEPIDEEALRGEPCWIGIDLASVEDLTAVVAAFRRPEGGYALLCRFFVPEATLRKRQDRDKLPYLDWAAQGLITATPGDVTDYGAVEAAIFDFAERFRVMEVAIDRWNSTAVTNRLQAGGLNVNLFGQGFASMSAPVRELERAIVGGKLQHGGHPVLRWNFLNVVADADPAGNVKFTKARSAEKIDGAVAAAMAVGRAFAAETVPSVYEERGALVF